jgi:hypothetical protein
LISYLQSFTLNVSYRLAGILTSSPLDPTIEARLVQHMPALFSTDLPPCGHEVQVAFQNVVHRLRRVWLATSPPEDPDTSIRNTLGVCTIVQHKLNSESVDYASLLSVAHGHLSPWRRASVFHYEVNWIAYFVREAQLMEKWPSLSVAEKEKQDFANRMYLIPKELGILVRNREVRKKIMEMWRVWNEGKRRGQMVMEVEMEEDK